MRARRNPIIKARRLVFMGCEGESEQGYCGLLSRLNEDVRKDTHFQVELLQPGAGDPLALVSRAVRTLEKARRLRGSQFIERVVFLDSDARGKSPERDAAALQLARTHKIRLLWQITCFEALLLRHLENCEMLRPPTSALAMTELKRRWPEYKKALPATRLAERISRADVLRCASVEPELFELLTIVGFT